MADKSPSSKRQWTDSQRAAIAHDGGDLLVSAAAGSGKTAVLAERCARLVCEGPNGTPEKCGVENLLVLTFTEAAATEMKSRIAAAIREKSRSGSDLASLPWLRRQAAMVERASISTLHAFCARVLRQHFHEAHLDPGFEVIDEDEARLLREEVLDALFIQWHTLKDSPEATAFADFLEAYAEGREWQCRETILRMHAMLASTDDPQRYLQLAKHVYTDGAADTMHSFMADVIGSQLRVLQADARRAAADALQNIGPGQVAAILTQKADILASLEQDLAAAKPNAWEAAQIALVEKWPTCKGVKECTDFDAIKKRTWEKIKDKMKALASKSFTTPPAAMLRDLRTLAPSLDALLSLTTQFTAAFTAAKRAQNRLDFNDLERETYTLLLNPNGQAVAELRQRYHFLLVDEFQDINPLQAALLAAIRSPLRFHGQGNLFVVGDVKQSIYGFRLADPSLFLQREDAARHGSGSFVSLPHNFRSRPSLLDVMNGLFHRLLTAPVAGIHYAEGHALQTLDSARATPLPEAANRPVECHLMALDAEEDESEDTSTDSIDKDNDSSDKRDRKETENLSAIEREAAMVAELITQLKAESRPVRDPKTGQWRPVQHKDIAILLRSVKNKAMIFVRALARRGIPAHADLATGYFDTPEVKDALALLQVLDNPQQDVPLATVLLGPYGRFSHDDLALLRLSYHRKEVPFHTAAARYAQDTADASNNNLQLRTHERADNAPPFNKDLADRLTAFFQKLAAWRNLLLARPLHEGLAEIYAQSQILAYAAGLDAGEQRVANLQMLHQRALKFAGFRKQGLHRFLRFIESLRDQDGDFGEAPVLSEASDVVRIMSVHKSKGLEFPIVFVSALGSKLILDDRGHVLIHRNLGVGLSVADIERNVFYPSAATLRIKEATKRSARAEELRLLYVAMTRARDHLFLTGTLNKQSKLAATRDTWQSHADPLPEGALLDGQLSLDWLLPALACCKQGQHNLTISWQEPHPPTCQVQVTLHTPAFGLSSTNATAEQQHDARAQLADRILHGQPLNLGTPTPDLQRLLHRVTGQYAHAEETRQPAVRTVTFLKTLTDEPPSDEPAPVPAIPITSSAPSATLKPAATDAAQAAKDRGIATHRILELLDFSNVATPAALTIQLDALIEKKLLTEQERDQADLKGITWFLHESKSGQRLQAAAKDPDVQLLRELPFTWTAPLPGSSSTDPADWPTIRGVIDLLLVNLKTKSAEILDYKTDAAALYLSRLPDYQRQMHYYLRAASDILHFPVPKATLLFLSPKTEHEVAP